MLSVKEWQERIHEWALSKGWWSRPQDTIGMKLLLVTTEVAEAAEELRKAGPCPKGAPDADYDDLRKVYYHSGEGLNEHQRDHSDHSNCKPEGFPTELADTVIRCLDLAERLGIDLDHEITRKMEYNWKRDNRHGGKLS